MAARAARGTKLVVIDPRRTETCEEADLHLAAAPGQRRRADERPARRIAATRAGRRGLSRRAASTCPRASGKRSRTAAISWSVASDLRPAAGRSPALLRPVRRPPAHRHAVQPGRSTSRSAAPTRSTRSSTSTSPPAASASPARRRSRSPASPTRWAGARSAGWPRRSPRTWTSRPRTSRGSRASGPRRAWRPGPASRRSTCSARSARAGSRRCGSWRPTRRSRCPTPAWCARRWQRCPFVVVSDCIADTDTSRFAHVRLPALGLGREGRHRHQLASG